MSRFQAGTLVVYGNLGVHEVEAWQKKKMKKRKISLNHARSG